MTRKKAVTAAELMAKLEADPDFVARRIAREEEHRREEAELRRAEGPLLVELRSAGFTIGSVWELVNTTAAYPEALPVLLDHLSRSYPPAVREGIARALAVPEAKFAWPALVRLYRSESNERTKDGLAVAIAAVADDEVIVDMIALARETQHGPSRLLLLSALERSRDPRARTTLVQLESDPELTEEVQVILRRRKRGDH